MGGGGDRSDVAAHIESPDKTRRIGAYVLGEGDRGTYGGELGERGGGEDDDRCVPSGRDSKFFFPG